jgi:malonyl CoA-acyl carrier protein transacylase
VLVFSGQGAQWPGMAKELIENDKPFRDDLVKMDQVLKGLEFPPSWNLTGNNFCAYLKQLLIA